MLQINLIPVERRRKERTPLPRFMAIIGAVVVCLGLLAWNVMMFMESGRLKDNLKVKTEERDNLKRELQDLPKLQQEKDVLVAWKNAADEVLNSRTFKWWLATDILLDILNEYPNLWITSLQTMESSQSTREKTPREATIRFDCVCFGKDSDSSTAMMTDFRRRLKRSPELSAIFRGDKNQLGINEELRFTTEPLQLPDAPEQVKTTFSIELYRLKEVKQ